MVRWAGGSLALLGQSWRKSLQICPYPRVVDFYPKKGPIEGGTELTIVGENLGRNFDDIKDAVRVPTTELCRPIKEKYITATKIVCITGSSRGKVCSFQAFSITTK